VDENGAIVIATKDGERRLVSGSVRFSAMG